MDGIQGIIDQNYVDYMVQQTAVPGSGDSSFDKDMFLNLLLTQLKNQDPFNTVETDKIMEQQAILSEVEQSIKQTEALETVKSTVDIGLAEITRTLNTINQTLQTLVNNNSGDNEGA